MPRVEERVLNGGFESTEDDILWDVIDTGGTGVLGLFPVVPHGGNFHVACVPDPGDVWGIYQYMNFTDVNAVTFWQGLGEGLKVYLDDLLLDTFPSVVWGSYEQRSVDVSTHTGRIPLVFIFADTEWTFLDDVSAIATIPYWYELPHVSKEKVWNNRRK